MTNQFTSELLSRMKPRFKDEYTPQGTIPLEIKLRLERLRLMEIIRSEAARQAPVAVRPAAAEMPMLAYAMT